MALFDPSGALRVSVVDGSTRTGLWAADGSINVVLSAGGTFVGEFHPCGALWVTYTTISKPLEAPDGSTYVTDVSNYLGAEFVIAVSGSLSGGGGSPVTGNPIGLLLTLTYA